MSTSTIVEQIKTMTVMELIKLKDDLMEIFGINSSMLCGPAPAAVATTSTGGAEAVAEKTTFNVILKDAGASKIAVIKAVRELTNLGLKEAKDLVDVAGSPIGKDLTKEEAERYEAKLKEAGATCEIK